ncbi:MAG: hydroxyacid dehydrogenase [Eubacteriales bacterium]|nr:hydroxyacid dehydrogenase [Eubacteriales bacterium]
MSTSIRAIMLSNRRQGVSDLYTTEILARVNTFCRLDPVCYTESDLEPAGQFADVGIIFSTWGMPEMGDEAISRIFPSLRLLLYAAGSVQTFARPFLRRGIRLCSAWRANAVPVAEYTLSAILLANKGFFQTTRLTRKDYRLAQTYSQQFQGNYMARVGIIGAGSVGSLVIEALKPYQMAVYVYDPFLPAERAAELQVTPCSLETLFSSCLTISNHLANLPETRGMLDYRLFSLMQPNATFINTGRGAQVVEDDLIRALREAPGRTALLDVFDPEPPRTDSELLRLHNVFTTPHIAGSMGREVERMADYMADECERWLNDQPLEHEVTLEMLKTMA